MATLKKKQRVDELLENASVSLDREAVFEAERMAAKAVALAHQIEDYAAMAEAIGPLLAARQRRREMALAAGVLHRLDEPFTERTVIEAGCYLVEPPHVGADARRLRLAAAQSEIPVVVVCREPKTQLGLWPIVAIGPGATIRAKVQPPDDAEHPDLDWIVAAMESIGDEAVETLDSDLDVLKRLRLLLDRLDAIPDHDGLHEALAQTCREAATEAAAAANGSSGSKSKAKS